MRFHFGIHSRENSWVARFPREELGEKCEKHIFAGESWRRARARIPRLSWEWFSVARKPRSLTAGSSFKVKVRPAFIVHRKRGEVRPHLLQPYSTVFSEVFQDSLGTFFQKISGTDFEEEIWHISQGTGWVLSTVFEGRTAAFNAVRTVRFCESFGTKIEGILAQKSRTDIDCHFGHFWEGNSTEIETVHAQKFRQPVGLFALVKISCIFYCKLMSDIFLKLNKISLACWFSPRGWGGFSRVYLTKILCLNVIYSLLLVMFFRC